MPILTDDERIGQVVGGGYRLDRILGRGGMGVVFAATHVRVPQMRSAVKFLNATYAQNVEVVERFMREAQAAAMLKHPNVVGVTDIGVSQDGAPYMMLEYLDGQTLSALLEERGSVSPQELMTYLRPVMSAVAFAHDSGIVHRDIKPDNIFLSRTGQGHIIPKVLDFGIAKLTREQSRVNGTVAGGVLGTPTYMAPEQAQGQNVGPWSDVWSMGVVLFEALSGGLPWEITSRAEVLQVLAMVMTEAPMSLRVRRPTLPSAIVEVVDRALSRDIGQRYHHMRDLDHAMASAIERISIGDTLEPGRVSTASKSATPFVSATTIPAAIPGRGSVVLPLAAGGGVAVLLAAVGFGLFVQFGGSRTSDTVHAGSAPDALATPAPPPPSSVVPAAVTAPDAAVAAIDPAPRVSDHSHHAHATRGSRSLTITPVTPGVTPTITPSHETTPDSPQVGRSGGLIPIDEP